MDYRSYIKDLGYTDTDIALILENVPVRPENFGVLKRYLDMKMPVEQINSIFTLANNDIDGSILEVTGLRPEFYDFIVDALITARNSSCDNARFFVYQNLVKSQLKGLDMLAALGISPANLNSAQENARQIVKAALETITNPAASAMTAF